MSDSPEKRIQEQRTIEATKKNLMGFDGKLGCIARNLGTPIIAEYSGGKYFSTNEMPDYMNLDDDVKDETIGEVVRKMRTMETDGDEPADVDASWTKKNNKDFFTTENTGWIFDGLSRGMHLEIKYSIEEGRITTYFKGYKVYDETAGELSIYNPNGDWEPLINKLYELAKIKESKNKKEDKKESQEKSIKNKLSWLQNLKDKWGI